MTSGESNRADIVPGPVRETGWIRGRAGNGVGEIIMDRPRALNAHDLTMNQAIIELLEKWRDDQAISTVIITSTTDRAFCAGGDIRATRNLVLEQDSAAVWEIFETEYRMDRFIASYPKPYISFVRGPAFGGGFGLAVHGQYCVVTDGAAFAMPEVQIGFIPDAGATHTLSRLGPFGRYMALTGARIPAELAVEQNIATHFIAGERYDEVLDHIRAGADPHLTLASASTPIGLASNHSEEVIDHVFNRGTMCDVVDAINALDPTDPFAMELKQAIRVSSPMAMEVTFELIKQAEALTFDECTARELTVGNRIITRHDYAEGVRAVVIDKDRNPAFRPYSLRDLHADPNYMSELASILAP